MQKSSNLTKRLAAYSAAATLAAGAGAVHAAGQLIDVNPDEVVVASSFDIDFDQDGRAEFQIRQTSSYVFFDPASSSGDVGLSFLGSGSTTYAYPYRLSTGDPINSTNTSWLPFASQNSLNYSGNFGNFIGAQGYIGVRFNLDGVGPYYGWIEVSTNADGTEATVYRYYYEDVQGGGLFAGQSPTAVTMSNVATTAASNPVSLMALLTGALTALSGLGLWVRQRFFEQN